MPDPNNVVMYDQKLVCMFTCKAGNTSVKRALGDALDLPHVDGMPDRLAPHRRLGLYLPSLTKLDARAFRQMGFLVIGFARHPMARLASCWRDKVAGPHFHHPLARKYGDRFWHKMPLGAFVRAVADIPDGVADQHFRSMTWDMVGQDDEMIPERLYRVDEPGFWETLRADLSGRCGIEIGEERHDNKTGAGSDWRRLFDAETLAVAERRYADDFRHFGYSMERAAA